ARRMAGLPRGDRSWGARRERHAGLGTLRARPDRGGLRTGGARHRGVARRVEKRVTDVFAGLRPPPGRARLPQFDRGWVADGTSRPAPFLSYLPGGETPNWSVELEALHEEAGRDHPIDRLTRTAVLAALGEPQLGATPVIVDIGCSAGRLLADLRDAWPG